MLVPHDKQGNNTKNNAPPSDQLAEFDPRHMWNTEQTPIFRNLLLLGCILIGIARPATGGITWTFDDPLGNYTEQYSLGSLPADLNVSSLSLGNSGGTSLTRLEDPESNGYTQSTGTPASGGHNIATIATAGHFLGWLSTYLEVTFKPKILTVVEISEVNFAIFSGGWGSPTKYAIRSSSDSFRSNIAEGSFSNNDTWSYLQNKLPTPLTGRNSYPLTLRIYLYGTGFIRGDSVVRVDDLFIEAKSVEPVNSTTSPLQPER